MHESEWNDAARTLAAEHAVRLVDDEVEAQKLGVPLPTAEHLRRALVELTLLFGRAPTPVLAKYKQVSEARLRTYAKKAAANLDEGTLVWLDIEPLVGAAAQLRAVDALLLKLTPKSRPTNPNEDFLCPEHKVHVVPRHAAKPIADAGKVGTPTYDRRGLIHHRIIPVEIAGYGIDLHWHRDLFLSMRTASAHVMGAIFDGLSLVRNRRYKQFVAREAPCADDDATLAAQVDAIQPSSTMLAVWPELTMPPERLVKLQKLLEKRALAAPPQSGGCIIAAGSWHEIKGEEVRNRMHILTSSGKARFHYDKSIALESKTLGMEKLTPSYRIPVLITEDALVTFAICRDFCENQISDVYQQLDVDLVVVPSYGDLKTINAHRQKAGILFSKSGARVFVVQQIVPSEVQANQTGYVLPPETDPVSASPKDLLVTAPGGTHPISFKRV